MTNPAAGWFADPHAPNFLRWWDGMQWTHHTHPLQPAAAQPGYGAAAHAVAQPSHLQVAPAGGVSNGFAASSGIANGFGASQAVSQRSAVAASAHPGSGAASSVSLPGIPATETKESLFESNPKSLVAIIVSALYLGMAIATGVVVAGIVPAIFTLRAFERREKLAPVAALAAAAAIGFAVTHWHTR